MNTFNISSVCAQRKLNYTTPNLGCQQKGSEYLLIKQILDFF